MIWFMIWYKYSIIIFRIFFPKNKIFSIDLLTDTITYIGKHEKNIKNDDERFYHNHRTIGKYPTTEPKITFS